MKAQINAMQFSRTQLPQLHVTVLHYVRRHTHPRYPDIDAIWQDDAE